MKKFIFAAALAVAMLANAAGELVATGADVKTWRLGEASGVALTNGVPLARTICPWKLYVTNAVKKAVSTQEVYTPTNYLVTTTIVTTNAAPVYGTVTNVTGNVTNITDTVTGLKYIAVSSTVTNTVLSLDGLTSAWTCIQTNGYTSVETNYTTTAAGGTVSVKSSMGDTWSISLSSGSGANASGDPDLTKLVFAGGLEVSASEAEKLDLRIVFLTFTK